MLGSKEGLQRPHPTPLLKKQMNAKKTTALITNNLPLIHFCILYMLLAMYFDKVLPGKYGIPHPPFFCLKPSYWVRSRRGSTREMPRTAASPEELLGDDIEPVPPEFMGKDAVRLNNIKKAYKKKDKKTEALRGMKPVILIPVKDKEKQLCKHFCQSKE
uniref:Uncharacterized protein n=1 Tax=Buteo japonicus TaxID=224669 RepID=A0A8C0BDZ8_9AVES